MKWLYAALIAGQLLDVQSTLRHSESSRELNPIMRPLLHHPIVFYEIKGSAGVGFTLGLKKYNKNHHKGALAFSLALLGAESLIVAHNYRVSR